MEVAAATCSLSLHASTDALGWNSVEPSLAVNSSLWLQAGASRTDTPNMSETETGSNQGATLEVPRLPDKPLQLLDDLYSAIKGLTDEIRQQLYSRGMPTTDTMGKRYSALSEKASATEEPVRSMAQLVQKRHML